MAKRVLPGAQAETDKNQLPGGVEGVAEELPQFSNPPVQLTPGEREFLAAVRRVMVEARLRRVNGTVSVEAVMKDGGIIDRWVTTKLREK